MLIICSVHGKKNTLNEHYICILVVTKETSGRVLVSQTLFSIPYTIGVGEMGLSRWPTSSPPSPGLSLCLNEDRK